MLDLLMLTLAQEEAARVPQGLTAGGWTFMLGSISMVLLLFGFCLAKVLGGPSEATGRMHGPLDIDTGDNET